MGSVSRSAGRGGRFAGRGAKRIALRSRWLARRIWVISAAEGALMARRHWKRLEPEERSRMLTLVRKSRGRPSQLSGAEHRELDTLLAKVGHAELLGGVVGLIVPFRFAGRLTERAVGGSKHQRASGRRSRRGAPTSSP